MATRKNDPEPSRAGVILAGISVLASIVSAIPIIHWHTPDGEQLPPKTTVFVVVLIGITVYAIGMGILWLFGISTDKQSEDKRSDL